MPPHTQHLERGWVFCFCYNIAINMHSSRSGRPVMAKHSTFASREEQGVHPSCVALLADTLNRIRRAIALSEGPRATDSVRSFGLQRNMFASFISPVCSQARNKAKIQSHVCSKLVRILLELFWICAHEQHTSTLHRCAIAKRSMDAAERRSLIVCLQAMDSKRYEKTCRAAN
jgi:hypothetical protein